MQRPQSTIMLFGFSKYQSSVLKSNVDTCSCSMLANGCNVEEQNLLGNVSLCFDGLKHICFRNLYLTIDSLCELQSIIFFGFLATIGQTYEISPPARHAITLFVILFYEKSWWWWLILIQLLEPEAQSVFHVPWLQLKTPALFLQLIY